MPALAGGTPSLQPSWPMASPPSVSAAPSPQQWAWSSPRTKLTWVLAPYSDQQPQTEPWEIALEAERLEQNTTASPVEHCWGCPSRSSSGFLTDCFVRDLRRHVSLSGPFPFPGSGSMLDVTLRGMFPWLTPALLPACFHSRSHPLAMCCGLWSCVVGLCGNGFNLRQWTGLILERIVCRPMAGSSCQLRIQNPRAMG